MPFFRGYRLLLVLALVQTLPVLPAAAQQQTVVEQLAPLLAAEDARNFQPDLFRRALVAPDSLVRRVAVLAAGRIGDFRATPLMLPLLADADSTVRIAAAFALGRAARHGGRSSRSHRPAHRPAGARCIQRPPKR